MNLGGDCFSSGGGQRHHRPFVIPTESTIVWSCTSTLVPYSEATPLRANRWSRTVFLLDLNDIRKKICFEKNYIGTLEVHLGKLEKQTVENRLNLMYVNVLLRTNRIFLFFANFKTYKAVWLYLEYLSQL